MQRIKYYLRKILQRENRFNLFQKITFSINKNLSKIFFGKSFFLRGICLMLTYKCNLSCKMCGFWGISGVGESMQQNLTLEDYRNVIDDLSKYHSTVIFSGGEPLLNHNWHELAKYTKTKKLNIVMQTNGVYIQQNAIKIIEYIDDLSISIDGTEEIHDKIRGASGTYKSIVEGMKTIDNLKKEKNLSKPFIDINFTISDMNYNYLIDTIDSLEKQNINIRSITFMHLMFFNENIFNEHKNKFQDKFNVGDIISGFLFNLGNLNADVLSQQIKIIKENRKKYSFDIIFAPDLKYVDIKRYYDSNYDSENVGSLQGKCLTPWLEAMVLPDGKVLNCMVNVLGNLKEYRFIELWNNESAREWRKYINKYGYPKICKNCRFRYM